MPDAAPHLPSVLYRHPATPHDRPVATYPPIGDLERDDALRRIALALDRHEDPRRSEAGTEPREVLAYLRSRHAQLPVKLSRTIARDQLILSAWIYWDERRRERELLKRTLRQGKSLAEVGAFLGIRTRQGVRDYLDRLDALLAEHHRSVTTTRTPATGDGATDPLQRHGTGSRAERGADEHATRAGRAAERLKPTRAAWIDRHHQRIATVIGDLLTQAGRLGIRPHSSDDDDLPDLGDYLAWLDEDHTAGEFDHGSFGSLGLVLGDLRTHPSLTELVANHGIHQAIRAADRLRADYADLTRESPVTGQPDPEPDPQQALRT